MTPKMITTVESTDFFFLVYGVLLVGRFAIVDSILVPYGPSLNQLKLLGDDEENEYMQLSFAYHRVFPACAAFSCFRCLNYTNYSKNCSLRNYSFIGRFDSDGV